MIVNLTNWLHQIPPPIQKDGYLSRKKANLLIRIWFPTARAGLNLVHVFLSISSRIISGHSCFQYKLHLVLSRVESASWAGPLKDENFQLQYTRPTAICNTWWKKNTSGQKFALPIDTIVPKSCEKCERCVPLMNSNMSSSSLVCTSYTMTHVNQSWLATFLLKSINPIHFITNSQTNDLRCIFSHFQWQPDSNSHSPTPNLCRHAQSKRFKWNRCAKITCRQ